MKEKKGDVKIMRKRSIKGYVSGNLKRKATQSRNDLAYMLMWGEEPPKKHHMVSRPRRQPLF
jgi:hypothetical protein